MTWHEALSLEVAAAFRGLAGTSWDRVEDALWQIRAVEHAAWSEHGQWWRKTTAGRRACREYARARMTLLKTVVVAVRACAACGRPFEVTAAQQAHSRGRVCSLECRGAARRNIGSVTIGSESMPLARWAERYGIALGLVWMRMKRGWTAERALRTPLANRGQKEAA